MKVLIYGYGWVGRSMLEFFEDQNEEAQRREFDVYVYDEKISPFIRDDRVLKEINAALHQVDYIFICIAKYELAYDVCLRLTKLGISLDKIKHIDNYFYSKNIREHLKKYGISDIINMWKNSQFDNKIFNEMLKVISKKCEEICYTSTHFSNMCHGLVDDRLIEEKELAKYYSNKDIGYPIIGVSGALGRSGTTLMTQWIASLGISEYPTNFLAPYLNTPCTPLVGFRNYIVSKNYFKVGSNGDFESNFGETNGLFNLLGFACSDIKDEELRKHDLPFLNEKIKYTKSLCAGICDISQRALSIKVSPQDIYILENIFKKSIYIVLERNIYTHVLALIDYYKRRTAPFYYDFPFLPKNLSFEKEPILYTAITLKRAMAYREKILSLVDENRKIRISYEEFCKNPKELFEKLIACCNSVNYFPNNKYEGIKEFAVSSRIADDEVVSVVDSVFDTDKYDINL
ncbi:hypothetical protein [Helicobacter sp.]|uniref:hypothetical protein n=1 Tax=Helicobacter sp. TaxID=218 RepID=UPI00258F800D|nr:hypothetical protein [Helicobacter sp.]MCI7765128.1 hypothetical protein [Helicobacter sp.]